MLAPVIAAAGPETSTSSPDTPGETVLVDATLCEMIEGSIPRNRGIVFSIKREKVICYTSFDPVIIETYIFHNWYRRDRLSTTRKLRIKPPRWNTFSSIYLRESDIGPWRVEITDTQGNILSVLRFNITE